MKTYPHPRIVDAPRAKLSKDYRLASDAYWRAVRAGRAAGVIAYCRVIDAR